MRFAEFILQEYTASKTQFSQILNDDSIRMGFECEMVSPEYDYDDEDRYNDDEDDDDRREEEEEDGDEDEGDDNSDEEPEFPDDMTFEELVDTDGVHISDRVRARINTLYNEWKESRLRDEWDVVRHSYVPAYLSRHPDRDKSDAYHAWVASRAARLPNPDNDEATPTDNDDSIDAFIRDKYGTMPEFMDEFGIEWSRYGDLRGEGPSHLHDGRVYHKPRLHESSEVHDSMARSLRRELGVRAIAGYSSNVNTWKVIEDGSIEGRGTGAEVVSGVYSLKEGLDKLEQTFRWMNYNDMETNDTTGLHVSFSIIGKEDDDDYDFLKMMIFFDENYTADLFGRLDQDYAKQMRDVLFRDMQGNDPATLMQSRNIGKVIAVLKKMGKSLPSRLGREKYHSFRHRADGVVEFRNMGGDGYQDEFSVIRTRIVNMAYAMKIGSDDKLMQRDYLKRIWAMLTTNKFRDPSLDKRPASRPAEVPYTLKAFTGIIQRNPGLMSAVKWGNIQRLIMAIMREVDPAMMSTLQRRQLRFALAKNKMSAETVRGQLGDDAMYNGLANVMGWPIVTPGLHPNEQEPLAFARQGWDVSGTPPEEYPDRNRADWRQENLPAAARSQTIGMHQNPRTARWGRSRS